MKTKSMVVKEQVISSAEFETVVGGKRESQKTYNGGTLQEIVVTPNK